ncbi:MAG: hypothetical protein ACI845_003563 [Gammaproteobacteria bacterium]|jgi:hypothetical protein
MAQFKILILDIGLYPESSALFGYLEPLIAQPDCELRSINLPDMLDEHWDDLLQDIMNAERCLTI